MNGFPKYAASAKLGDVGVGIVSSVVQNFGWLFKTNHQEHDFGIDGQIEIVSAEGAVTGQMLATQIKCGASFFKESNPWGYVYRGEMKHFNYLANYPMPVIIVICDPGTKEAYWVRFEPQHAKITRAGWSLTIPYESKLARSHDDILTLLPPPADYISLVKEYWKVNNHILGSSNIIFTVDREEVDTMDVSRTIDFIQRLRSTKELAHHCKGKLEIAFSSYDVEPRELFEIDSVKRFVEVLDLAVPELFFFCRTEEPASTIRLFLFCLVGVGWAGKRAKPGTPEGYMIERGEKLANFLNRHFAGLNRICEWLSLPQSENDVITRSVGRILGVPSSARQ